MDRKEILRRNLDRVIWDIEKARVSVSEPSPLSNCSSLG